MKSLTNSRTVRFALGVAVLLTAAANSDAQNQVRFKVDMSATGAFIPGTHTVEVRGDGLGWGPGLSLTNDPGTPGVYENVYDYPGAAGDSHSYKFWYSGADIWETPASTCGNNRTLILAGGAQTLPTAYFNDAPPVMPDNNVTFQVDMTAQVLAGAFTNGSSTITIASAFAGWDPGVTLTNNPALSGTSSNVYRMVVNAPGVVGACQSYKFRANGGWESPASTGGNNRSFQLAGGDQVLPLVYYNDASPCDLIQQPTLVTFRLHVPNGTTSQAGDIVFDRSVNKLYLNGEFLGWWTWNSGFGGSEGPQYEMTNNPVGSEFFEQTFTIPPGKTLATTYKYCMDGFDNEAPAQTNHIRYVRSLSGVAYTMPVDLFGTNVALPVIEASFGNLSVAAPSGAYIPITWSGRQCVTLQTKSAITGGVWQDIAATEGTSATNWPNSGAAQFFRLKKAP